MKIAGRNDFLVRVVLPLILLLSPAAVFALDNVVPQSVTGADSSARPELAVYPHVPGLEQSPHYRYRVRQVGSEQWLSPFAFVTKCATREANEGAYYSGAIGGWTQTYCNFEMADHVPVEVEITRLEAKTLAPVDIRTAVPHPRRKVRSWRVENGKAYVIFEHPALFAVDIDGQLDDHPLPKSPPGGKTRTGDSAIHTVTVFANPFIHDKPDLKDPTVLAVNPGERPPADGAWKTLYFKPGVHQFWQGTWKAGDQYYFLTGKNYYIPGDALVHGNFSYHENGTNTIRLFGHGTLTQERITHALHQQPPLDDKQRGWTSAVKVGNAVGTRIEGITITDSPDHSLWISGSFNPDPATFNYVRWVKTITWRANGDGMTVGDNDFLEDGFIRAQDDGTYLKGRSIRRMVYWTDCNGKALKINMITKGTPDIFKDRKLFIEDIDIIYGRSSWPAQDFHVVLGGDDDFPVRRGKDGSFNHGSHIVFRNINYEDPLPLRKFIGFGTKGARNQALIGIRFENLRAVAPCMYGFMDDFSGTAAAPLRDFVLDDVVVGGRQLRTAQDVTLNEFVTGMVFAHTEPAAITFLNRSGYGKWYMRHDWSGSVEPADHDLVLHTAQAGTLIVDGPAWAGSLKAAHAGTAVIRLAYSGRLSVSDTLTLGDPGGARGELHLPDGEVVLRKGSDDALALMNGGIRIEQNGTLLWAGDRIAAVKRLLAARHLSLGAGRDDLPRQAPYDHIREQIRNPTAKPRTPRPVLIGEVDGKRLYADLDQINPGYTTVWVGSK